MGLVDEEHQLGFLGITHFREGGVDLGQKAEHEGAEELGTVLDIGEAHDVHNTLAILLGQQVVHLEAAFTEEGIRALLFDLDQLAQDDVDGGRTDLAVLLADLVLAFVGHELEYPAKVLQIDQAEVVVIAVLEHQGQHALLGVVQVQYPAQEHRAELAHRGT